jgi:hypothetical protein
MLRAGVRTVKVAPAALGALALVLASLSASGCFARRYPALMEKHLEVLSLYAGKLVALAEDDRTVPAQDWGEFTYPLERAREFARVARARYPERESLREFDAALAAYATLVEDPAVLSAPDSAATVAARAAAFTGAATATRAALAREAAG